MLVFLTYPVAPPRFLSDYGFIDTVTLHSESYRVLQPPALANLYAAMPSLHFGWNFLMGIAVWRESRSSGGKLIALLISPAMFLAIVLTANHFILDGLVGGALVLASLAVVTLVPTRLRVRRSTVLHATDSAPIAPVAGSAEGDSGSPDVPVQRPAEIRGLPRWTAAGRRCTQGAVLADSSGRS
jgi:hypothetical protein